MSRAEAQHPYQNLILSVFLNVSHSGRTIVSHIVLVSFFLMTTDGKLLFIYFLDLPVYTLQVNLLSSLPIKTKFEFSLFFLLTCISAFSCFV